MQDRGMNWKAHLTDQERARYEAIPAERAALTRESRRIWDRCRKRMVKARADGVGVSVSLEGE